MLVSKSLPSSQLAFSSELPKSSRSKNRSVIFAWTCLARTRARTRRTRALTWGGAATGTARSYYLEAIDELRLLLR